MNHFLLALALLSPLAAFADDAAPRQLAFERGSAVYVAKIDGSSPKKIARGQSPELSPDGKKLAFNTVQEDGKPAARQIAIADLATGGIVRFKEIPSENCMAPAWSADGTRLLFYFYLKNQMRIGTIAADGTDFQDVQASEVVHHDYWAAAWGPDGKSIFCEDMESLYQLSLEAKIMKQWKVEKLFPRGGMSGNMRFHLSWDQKTLLLDVEMAEQSKRKEWDGPLPSIWSMDLATEKTVRLTPGSVYAWDAHWLSADAILFTSQGAGEKEPSIYRMSLSGKERKLLVKDARMPSAAP